MAMPCFMCNAALKSAFAGGFYPNQPLDGTTFRARGQYGSTVFDPMDDTWLEVNICDNCLVTHAAFILKFTPLPERNVTATSEPWVPDVSP